MSYSETPEDQRIPRELEMNQIVTWINAAIQGRPRGLPRLIVIKGGAGVGKTYMLEMLEATLAKQVPNCRVVGILNVKQLVMDQERNMTLHDAFDLCCGDPLKYKSSIGDPNGLASHADAMRMSLSAKGKAKMPQPVVVLADELEWMLDSTKRTYECRNLLFDALLQQSALPVIVVCAARHTHDQPMPYFGSYTFHAVKQEVHLKPFDRTMIDAHLASTLSSSEQSLLDNYAQGNPDLTIFFRDKIRLKSLQDGLAKHFVLREAIEWLTEPHPLPKDLREKLWELAQTNCFTVEDAVIGNGPSRLEEIRASSWVDYNTGKGCYFVCEPLARLLQEVDHV